MELGSALIPVARASDLEAQAKRESAAKQMTPMIQGLAAHVRKRWEVMRDHKRKNVEERLSVCVRARNMEYEPSKLAEIREQGGSEIFMASSVRNVVQLQRGCAILCWAQVPTSLGRSHLLQFQKSHRRLLQTYNALCR